MIQSDLPFSDGCYVYMYICVVTINRMAYAEVGLASHLAIGVSAPKPSILADIYSRLNITLVRSSWQGSSCPRDLTLLVGVIILSIIILYVHSWTCILFERILLFLAGDEETIEF